MRYKLIQTGLEVMGLIQADRWLSGLGMGGLKQGCGFILTLHRVRPATELAFAPNRFLDITPDFLDHSLTFFRQAGFEPLAMDRVAERLARPPSQAKPFFVVSFDDGYCDVLDHAWPVLRKHRCPWTIYITGEYASGRGRIWWLELEDAIARNPSIHLQIGPQHFAAPTQTPAQKQRAYERLRTVFYSTSSALWPDLLDGLGQHPAGPSALTPAKLCADWDALAALNRDPDVTIGSHTLTHPILSRISDAQAHEEIVSSKSVLSKKLGEAIRHFSYPSGGPTSFSARDVALVKQAGYQTAVTTRPAHLWHAPSPDHARDNPLLTLPRISLNGHFQSDRWLRAIVSGLPFKKP